MEGKVPIPESPARMIVVESVGCHVAVEKILEGLRADSVILVRNLEPEQAEQIMVDVAGALRLGENLRLQAGFAGFLGHRHNIGQYYMSVNERESYQFISPHSEGNSFVGMELASFYCYENSTDGGESVLMNVNGDCKVWTRLRERVRRGRIEGRTLSSHEIQRARGLYNIRLPDDVLGDSEVMTREFDSEIPGLTVIDALAMPRRSFSRILERELYVYWDTVASIDLDAVPQFAALLRADGLLREPVGGLDLRQMDNCADFRIWHSRVDYRELFKCKVTRKLEAGDFILQNNMTWTHAASNWSPGSGVRKVAACFA